jgi:ATP-dependent 26S proteasome regulatory subunit
MPSTFESLYLPSEVIDSIRSLVSLPLLFPEPFRCGILKQQSMTGALLFGPPGTGKTLVAKALAAESKARMVGSTMSLPEQC